MTQFIVKGKVKYQGKLYTSGQVVEVQKEHIEEFKKHGWQIVKDKKQENKNQDNQPDYSKMTNDELKEVLTQKGIEYPEKAKKADLLALLA